MQTAKAKLLTYLKQSNRSLSVAQARARFNYSNISGRINELRNDGHPIRTVFKTRSDGRRQHFYRYGTV